MAESYGVGAHFHCICGYATDYHPDLRTAKESRAAHFRTHPKCRKAMKGAGYHV